MSERGALSGPESRGGHSIPRSLAAERLRRAARAVIVLPESEIARAHLARAVEAMERAA